MATYLRDAVASFGDTGLGDANILALDGRTAGLRAEPILSLWEEIAAADSGDDWQQILAQLQQDGITGQATAAAVLELACRRGSLLVYLDDAESIQTPRGALGASLPVLGAGLPPPLGAGLPPPLGAGLPTPP